MKPYQKYIAAFAVAMALAIGLSGAQSAFTDPAWRRIQQLAQTISSVWTFTSGIVTSTITATTSAILGSAGTAGSVKLYGTDGTTHSDLSASASGQLLQISNPLSLTTNYLSETWTAGVGGTTANELVSFNTVPRVVLPAAGATDVIGVALSTASSGNPVEVAIRGRVACIADNATTAGNLAIVGTGTVGTCRDAGTANRALINANVQIIGTMLTAVSGGATASVELFGPSNVPVGPLPSGVQWTAGTATLAQINAGQTILTAVTGRTVRVIGVYFKVTGGFTTCTDVRLSDTNSSPVDVVTIAVAGLTTGNRIGDFTVTNVTWGSFLAQLTADKGLQLRHTGSACAAGTSIDYRIFYSYS